MNIVPLSYSLPDLAGALPLDDSDLACLSDIKDILARYGKLRRFALHMAHQHFKLGEDEILIERPDPDGRTQHVSVGRRDDEPNAVPTTWLFDDGPALSLSDAVYCVCRSDSPYTDACSGHRKSPSPSPAHQKEEAIKQKRINEEKALYDRGFPVVGHDRER